MLKIKHILPNDLKGIKVRTKNGVIGYIVSQTNCTVFLCENKDLSTDRGRLYPQIIKNEDDYKEWDLATPSDRVNCDSLTSLKYIINE